MSTPGGLPAGLRPAEEEELLRAGPLGLPTPAYGGRSLPNVTASIVRALGANLAEGPELLPPLVDRLDPFGGRRAEGPVVLLLVDGLGWWPFSEWSRSSPSPIARAWGTHAHPVTTVFPTTTVSALTSLSSGTAPSQHGVVGPNLYLPRLGRVVDVLRMSPIDSPGREELVTERWTPAEIAGAPPIFRRGIEGTAVSRHVFARTGFNRVLYDGASFVGYATASDLAHVLVELLGRPAPPRLVLAYWDELDTVQHLRGTDRASVRFEADRLAHLVDHVAREVGPGRAKSVRWLISADHGLVPVEPDRQLRVDLIPEIEVEMSRPLAGDRRAGYFAARPGRKEALEAALARRLPTGYRVVRVDDAVRAGLYGPPPFHPELRERIGDLVVLPAVPDGLLGPSPRPESRSPSFRGSHSGLDAEELLVPLIAGSLYDLTTGAGAGGQP